ncbi:MAG: TrkA family potassium uptake protein [Ruminococcus sp.]|nr:TrkA family potassium uptake protein [Ruminococcus sp.]
MKSILVLGAGEFGSTIAKRMSELGCDVLSVDSDENVINEISPYVTNAMIGDCTNRDLLRSLGIPDFDICVVALGGLFQASLEATCTLKELGAKFVMARATNDVQMKFLRMVGADEIAYPEKQTAIRFATRYASDMILDFIRLDSNYSIYEIKVPKDWVGKTLVQTDVRRKHKVNIITVKRGDSVFIPHPETVFMENDITFVIGEMKDIRKCFKI